MNDISFVSLKMLTLNLIYGKIYLHNPISNTYFKKVYYWLSYMGHPLCPMILKALILMDNYLEQLKFCPLIFSCIFIPVNALTFVLSRKLLMCIFFNEKLYYCSPIIIFNFLGFNKFSVQLDKLEPEMYTKNNYVKNKNKNWKK